MRDRPIEEVLGDLGLTGAAAERGRVALEEAGVTRPGKQRLAEGRVRRARAAIEAAFSRLCRTCAASRTGDGREVVIVPARACTYCGGSGNARAMRDLIALSGELGVERLVVVGGSPRSARSSPASPSRWTSVSSVEPSGERQRRHAPT